MQELSKLTEQLFKYIIAGALSTALDATIFAFIVNHKLLDFKGALVISYSSGTFLNFWLCYFFIFPSTNNWFKSLLKHNSFSMFILFVQQLLMILLVSGFKFNNLLISRITVSGCTFLINFLFFKNFAFKRK